MEPVVDGHMLFTHPEASFVPAQSTSYGASFFLSNQTPSIFRDSSFCQQNGHLEPSPMVPYTTDEGSVLPSSFTTTDGDIPVWSLEGPQQAVTKELYPFVSFSTGCPQYRSSNHVPQSHSHIIRQGAAEVYPRNKDDIRTEISPYRSVSKEEVINTDDTAQKIAYSPVQYV